jgi:microcystin degradation protein MlrC
MVFLRPGEHPADTPLMCTATLWAARRRAERDGFMLIEGSCFAASPGGPTNTLDYEFMRDEILTQLRAALPLDGVLFGLHGAMVAFGYDDVEGDLLERARAIVGDACIIGVEFDLHCHLTRKRVALADAIVLYKEYPHTDTVERADELLDILLATIRGQTEPVMALYDCRQIGNYPTTHPEMRCFVDWVAGLERPPILSISLGHSYVYGDMPELGARVLVVADGDVRAAERVATEVGQRFIALRERIAYHFYSVDAAIDAALAHPGAPIDARVDVIGLARGGWQTFGPSRSSLGDMAGVRVNGIDVVLNATRTQAYGPEVFSNVGIDPRRKKILVLKSSTHFMAGYGAFIADVVHAHSDGLLRRDDLRLIAYRRVTRPIWPLDDSPVAGLLEIAHA